MARDGYQDRLSRDALVSGRGAYPESGAEELAPDVVGSRLLAVAQWLALAVAIVTVVAGFIAAAAIASSRDSAQPQITHGLSDMARGSGALIAIGGVFLAIVLAVVIFAVARDLLSHPRGGAIVFFIGAAILGTAATVMLAAPGLVVGEAGNAAARTASSSLSDAQFAGLALLTASALAATAGALTAVELARVRRRDAAKSAEHDLT